MDQTLKITNTLADPTRFSIYQYMVQHHKEVSVQDIANSFGIHPNVARLHLSKLEDVHIIQSDLNKTGKGGRPGRVYQLSDKEVQLSFPKRDFKLLSEIALTALYELGDQGLTAAMSIGEQFGKELVHKKLQSGQSVHLLSFDEKIELLESISSMIGYFPEIEEKGGSYHICFVIYNCPFKLHESYSEIICKIHTAFLEGAFSQVFEKSELHQVESIFKSCQNCQYHVIVTN
ncbi:putative ArsR family transcriptional regulator [Oikeobacillus pervagus]|uniref:ArsR family transcriptional regulator n=1 Tax=Oikeobacillus pervagus TaxID=1325931 RepID=A0AAJ1T2V6_9BACI|nr:helix-turn-helix domain-containing protein [Oikeobacillus pervagus]MDQ0213860.1 putative ArsR family transcriptional regulator [Oikeobacillus pervagus]